MRIHPTGWVALGIAILVAAAPQARAQQATGGDNEALRREVDDLKRKVEALERAGGAAATAPAAGGAAADEDAELQALREDAAKTAEGAPVPPGSSSASTQPGRPGGSFGAGFMPQLNAFNPRMTVFGDFVGRIGLHGTDDELETDDRMSMREVELDFRADVDPYAKGVVIIAFEEEEPGEYIIDVEEGYVTLETLPWNFRAQIGRVRERFGQANRTHQHDLMWVDYPLVMKDFLGDEGLIGDGVSLIWLAPGIPLELEATVLNGENGAVLAGSDSDFPAFLGRANYYLPLPGSTAVNIGASILHGKNDADNHQDTQLIGGDLLFQWRPTAFYSVTALSEVFLIDKDNGRNTRNDHAFGWYGSLQLQPIQQLYFGARYEWSDYGEQIEDNDQWAASVYASWYTTEFLRFRVGYEHRERRSTGFPGAGADLDTLLAQVTFVFGSHPVEPFWVNR
jgi:hypothetical protein